MNTLKIVWPFGASVHNRVLISPETNSTWNRGDLMLQQKLLGITKLPKINGMWLLVMNKFIAKWWVPHTFYSSGWHARRNSPPGLVERHGPCLSQRLLFSFSLPDKSFGYVAKKIKRLVFEFKILSAGQIAKHEKEKPRFRYNRYNKIKRYIRN